MKTVLEPGERTACYAELPTSESAAVDGVLFSLTARQGTAMDATRFAQDPQLVQGVMKVFDTSTGYQAELRNPGPAHYRSFGESFTGSLRSIAVFRDADGILSVDAAPICMRLGHIPVGETLDAHAIGFPKEGERVEEVELFFGMRPLPQGKQPISREVTDLDWSVDEREDGEALSISAEITNHSAIAAEAHVTTHLVKADGSNFLSIEMSLGTVEAGGRIAYGILSRMIASGSSHQKT